MESVFIVLGLITPQYRPPWQWVQIGISRGLFPCTSVNAGKVCCCLQEPDAARTQAEDASDPDFGASKQEFAAAEQAAAEEPGAGEHRRFICTSSNCRGASLLGILSHQYSCVHQRRQ